jgi:hypothetical protein
MTDREKLIALALCLKGIDDAYEELADFKASVKARIETLLKESHALRFEILSGQESLPLEPISADSHPVSDTPAMGSRTQESASSGESEGQTQPTSAEFNPVIEANAEERSRARKAKRARLRGQSAILPDPRKPGDPPAGVQP